MPYNKRHFIILFFIVFAICLTVIAVSFAEELDAPIECNGDEIEYLEDEKKVIGNGHVIITYKDTTLTCDKVTVWTTTREARAEGNVKIVQDKNLFSGDSITYNLEKQTGTVVNFAGYTDPWYAKGNKAERTGPDLLIVDKGYVTTCDHKKPHYRISARKVFIYPNKKVVVRDATFWLGPVPVLWMPVYAHPLDDNRPRVAITPGNDKEWGYFLLTAWRYDLGANNQGRVRIDYREKKDFAGGFDHRYDTNMIGAGTLRTYYMHERDINRKRIYAYEDDKFTTERERFMAQWRHKWQMFSDTLAVAELYKSKDVDFRKDYFNNKYDNEYEADKNPQSYLLVTKTQPLYNLSIFTLKRANRFEAMTEQLPEVKLAINNNRIDRANYDSEDKTTINRGALYYTGEFSAVNLNEKSAQSTDENPVSSIPINHNNRYDTYNKVSYATNLYFLNVTPFAAMRQTYYDRGTVGHDFGSTSHIDGVFYTGVDISTKFYKAFHTQCSPLGIEINNLRHIITPSVAYSFNPPSTLYSSSIFGFLGGNRSNSMAFSLENKLQTKRGKHKETIELARLGITTSYNLVSPAREFADYQADLELRPYSWLGITSHATINSHKRYHHEWLKQTTTDVSFGFKDFRLGAGHSYVNPESNNITGQLEWRINPEWKIKAYESFDIKRVRTADIKKMNDLREQRYTITKDLHCWEVDVNYNVIRERGEELLIIFRLKAFPDMPFAYGKNYHEPKRGSQDYSSLK